jgi:hypothetical protein
MFQDRSSVPVPAKGAQCRRQEANDGQGRGDVGLRRREDGESAGHLTARDVGLGLCVRRGPVRRHGRDQASVNALV